jgi:tetratricopeptide (TPR) repeat protein
LAQDIVEHDQGEEDLLQRVDLHALAAWAAVAEPQDPSKWVKSCANRAEKMMAETNDKARQMQLDWQLGMALAHAASIEHARSQYDKSLEYGRLAIKHMQAGDDAGKQLPHHDFLLGQAYYKLGATAAIGDKNHRQAVEWYAQAVTLLETPVPPSRLSDPGRQGESFVSIAVSYWELGKRDEALRLTKQGLKLMEQAIDEGLLEKSALSVPYGNMASMHAELGDKRLAAEFAELSAKCERTKR